MGRLNEAKTIRNWTIIKHNLVPRAIDGEKKFNAETKKGLKKKVEAFYKQFDGGLIKSLKKANDTGSEKDALKALAQSIDTTKKYLGKLKSERAKWATQPTLRPEINAIGDTIERALSSIYTECKRAAKQSLATSRTLETVGSA